MIIMNLSPVFSDEILPIVKVKGLVICVNGEDFDFSQIPPGYSLPQDAIESSYFLGPATRDAEGTLTVTLRLPHAEYAEEHVRFPAPIEVVRDGIVELPFTEPPVTEEPLNEPD